jgi:hypothetical protein
MFVGKEQSHLNQGGQIGRIFAIWVIVYFGQFLHYFSKFLGNFFPQKKLYINLYKNGLGFILGIFSQIHLVTLT